MGRVDKKLLCASGNFTVQTEVGASPTAAWRDASRWLCGCSVSADGQSKQLSGLGSAAAIREANERAEDGRPAVASRPDSAHLRTFLHGQESVARPWTMARLDTGNPHPPFPEMEGSRGALIQTSNWSPTCLILDLIPTCAQAIVIYWRCRVLCRWRQEMIRSNKLFSANKQHIWWSYIYIFFQQQLLIHGTRFYALKFTTYSTYFNSLILYCMYFL